MILDSQRHKFALPRELCYLNAAYMGPQPLAALAVTEAQAQLRARPWQVSERDFFTEIERARGLFARIIGAETDDIAIVPSVSYGLAVAARNITLEAGQRIVALEGQFPSNAYPWLNLPRDCGATVDFIARPEGDTWTDALLTHIAAHEASIAIVALPNHHWANGAAIDLVAVGEAVRKIGARLVLDTTQSLGAAPFDLAAIDPDFVASAGYKWLFCPYGISFLYVAKRNQDGVPLEENWINRLGSEDFSRLVDYQPAYQPGARRFDAGERPFFAVPAASTSMEMILDWGIDNIAETLASHNRTISAIFAEAGYRVQDEAARGPHLMGVVSPEPLDADFSARLRKAGVSVSIRGNAIRIAPHVYNDEEDFERLRNALA